jgi:RecA/RadA recombinase
MNVHQQELTLENAVVPLLEKERKNEKQKKVALLIVDSVINNYRSEFLGQGMLPQRQQKLYRFMCLLSTVSQNYGIAVVVTNQVNSSEANSIFWGSSATGGNVMAYTSTIRVSLTRLPNGNKIAASIIKSSYHLENQTCLMVSEKGIEDPMNIRAFVTSS